MLEVEHSEILSTFIILPFVINIFVVVFWVAVLHMFYYILYPLSGTTSDYLVTLLYLYIFGRQREDYELSAWGHK